MKIKWFGHSAFEIKLNSGTTLLLDPFLDKNPASPIKSKNIKRADFILVSHGHYDHLGDTILIASRLNSKLIAMVELGVYCRSRFLKNVEMMNICSPLKFGEVEIGLTPAAHSTGIGLESGEAIYAGMANGFIIKAENKTIYFAGDTGLFSDLKLIGEVYKPDLAILPIGGRFTMDCKEAALAAKWINSEIVLPMHYGSLPGTNKVDPQDFQKEVKKQSPKTKCIILQTGEEIEL